MQPRSHYGLQPLPIGAEIHQLDLTRLDDPATRRDLYEDWMKYGVLVFRDTAVDNVQHLKLSRVFGELEMHPLPEIRNDEEPLLMQLGGNKPDKAFVYDDKLLVGRVAWHRDTAYTVDICKGAMLRVLQIPEENGQTLFCDTAAAYDALPEPLKTRIEGLEFKATLVLDYRLMKRGITWSKIREATETEAPGLGKFVVPPDAIARYPSVVHPLVITHPESGRKCIYISPTYLDAVLGLDEAESDALLDQIVEHTLRPDFIYTHEWRPNDLVLWDNRRMMHAAAGWSPQHKRLALRTTFAGSLKSGRLYDPNAVAARAALVD